MDKNKAVISIDLGGTKIAGCIIEPEGILSAKKVIPIDKREGKEVGSRIRTLIQTLSGSVDTNTHQLTAIGVAVPGIYYKKKGMVWAPNIPGWESYPLREELQSAAGPHIPVFIDSDRACYILGETWKGVARGCTNAVFLAVGTGIGAGILIDGNVLRGSNDIAGATGWLALNQPWLPEYNVCGCFEYHASGAGILKNTKIKLEKENAVLQSAPEKSLKELNTRDVFTAYEEKDPVAVEVLSNAVVYWGQAVANFVSLFDPEMIIFGGGVFGPAKRFLKDIRLEAEKWAQPISMKQVRLEVSGLGDEAGLYGAGFLAIKHLDKS